MRLDTGTGPVTVACLGCGEDAEHRFENTYQCPACATWRRLAGHELEEVPA